MGAYLRPATLEAALDALAARKLTVIAGATDHYPARVGRVVEEDILDLTAIRDLAAIEIGETFLRIGATATWTAIAEADLPAAHRALGQAAREIGGRQIQNAGTIGGNVCNASPAADGVVALMALDAQVEIADRHGRRLVPLADFVLGNRKIALRPDQLVVAFVLPRARHSARSGFVKLGARKFLVIGIVMVAAAIEVEAGVVVAARVAVGAAGPKAQRLPALEAALIGRASDAVLGEALLPAHLAPLSPIDDIRADAAYRRDAAATLIRRLLSDLGRGA